SAQLDPAREVRHRRHERLRHQPRRVQAAARHRRAQGGRRLVRRLRREQLLVEPTLDLREPERKLRLPRRAVLPRRARGARRQPAVARGVPRLARMGQARLAGGRDRARHAAQLHREQALVVQALKLVALVAVALVLAPVATAGTTGAAPTTTTNPIDVPLGTASHLPKREVIDRFLADGKVRDWLKRYPKTVTSDATYSTTTGDWTVQVFSGKAGEVATGTVNDATGVITEAWTGPQVAWRMARGYPGQFGGKQINS